MPSDDVNAKLRWEAGDVPVSGRFDDPYYSREDGLAESRYVFLEGNDLPARFRAATEPMHIAELGFGTGLNMLAVIALWQAGGRPVPLRLTSFEGFPLEPAEISRALSCWPELAPLAEALVAQRPAPTIDLAGATLSVIAGDVNESLATWSEDVDAWFLDGFAPARNPEMWTNLVLGAVGRTTRSGGTFATYTAAGFVRRSLAATGFDVRKRPGFGSKREMLIGRKA